MRSHKLFWVPLLLSMSLSAQTFNVLHSFANTPDGEWPRGGLALDGGTLYGATESGGSSFYGTLFQLGTNGAGYSIMRSFVGSPDGSSPQASVIVTNGVIYGTTLSSGAYGYGSVFKMNANGTAYQVLKSFGANINQTDGAFPSGKLAFDGSALYGTVSSGGISNNGAVFRVRADGTNYSLVKSFYLYDGWNPQAGVTLDNGVLYGTTYQGGTNSDGEVFKVNTDGSGFAVIRAFSGGDGSSPKCGLVVSGGVIYGSTYSGFGTVFKMNTDGTGFSTLKGFNGSNGGSPQGALVLNGNALFGTAYQYGGSGNGEVFKVNTDGSGFAILHTFSGSDGANPVGDLVFNGGVLYGTTFHGGSASEGVIFSLVVPPPPTIVFDRSLGVLSNCFGFTITGSSNQAVAIDACGNLAAPIWTALQTNTFGTNSFYFKDPGWTNYSTRFYRLREP